jgi:hypothetical protein
MATIIAGRFEQQDQVQATLAEMIRAGFSEDQMSSFYVNPPGQHDRYAIGGDRDKSPGAEKSAEGTSAGIAAGGAVGAAIGATTIPVTGPLGPAAGALVGAHVGQLVGALGKLEDDGGNADENDVPVRQAGLLVAVSVPEPAGESRAIDVLRSLGAADIERTEGTIVDGDWKDFDPVAPPAFVEDRQARR